MAGKKKNKFSKKELQAAIDLSYENAAFLFNDKEKVNEVLTELEEFINNNETIINHFDELKRAIEIIKYTVTDKCNVFSPEGTVSILSGLMYLHRNFVLQDNNENENPIIDYKSLCSYIEKTYKRDFADYDDWEKWKKEDKYPIVPITVINEKEQTAFDKLNSRYEKLTSPTLPAKAAEKAKDLVPQRVKDELAKVMANLTEKELYEQIMKRVADGFDILVKQSAKVTISEATILKQINKTFDNNHIFTLDEICYARSYDVSKLVNKFKTQNVFIAFAEGGATGALGLPGIPANLAASMFIYYRAIQSIAMYYGYDIKRNPDELQIATEVFMQAMSPNEGSASEMGDMIVKFMSMSEALVVKDVINGGWKAMAEHGGICLLITQIRALAHKSAEKALAAAGKKGLEETMFTNFLKQIGKKMGQESVKKAATPIAAIITAFTDVSTMNKVIEFADVFYSKRFITEKQTRLDILNSPDEIHDVEFEVVE